MATAEACSMEEDDGDTIIACDAPSIDGVYVLKHLIGYILFMHNQIPEPLDELESENLTNFAADSRGHVDSKQRREKNRRMRSELREMKKLHKLICSIKSLLSASRVAFQEFSNISSVFLVLGPSLRRPFVAYELQFFGITPSIRDMEDKSLLQVRLKSENICRKIIRALLSHLSNGDLLPTGSMKFFFLIQADQNSYGMQEFIPKRGFVADAVKNRRSQKVKTVVIKLMQDKQASDDCSTNSSLAETIWFQYKVPIKGGRRAPSTLAA